MTALFSGCTTISPCFSVGTDSSLHQVAIKFGGEKPKGNICESSLNNDYLDPPIPFEDNMDWKD
jgi:hypothetical protein